MSFKEKFLELKNKFEDLLFVESKCLCCDKETDNSNKFLLCKNCESLLEKQQRPTLISDGEFSFDKNVANYIYNDTTALIVKKFKYYNRMYYSKYIARMMTENLQVFKNVDYLTFIPISKSRFKERGFNQAEELAKDISKITGIEIVDFLYKDDGGVHQAGLSREDRRNNLFDCFHLKDEIVNGDKKKFENKIVLIVDDVMTTGTTLSRCAEVLRELDFKYINTITFARTDWFYIISVTYTSKMLHYGTGDIFW